MKKVLSLLIILCLIPLYSEAIEPEVQKFEGGIFGGFTIPVGGYHGGSPQMSINFGAEGRYNFRGTPWDCGVLIELTSARRGYNHLFNDNRDRWQNNRSLIFAAVGHYNFRQGETVNPFVGLAYGDASHDVVGDEYFPSSGTSMFYGPRAGVELFHHIRITGQLNISRVGYNNFSLSIGVVLGGRPKKQ